MSHKITALNAQQGRKNRVNVFLDGAYAFSLADIVAARLRVGQEIDDQHLSELIQQDAVESAYESCLHYLSYRPRTAKEMRRYLQKKGLDEQTIESILGRLTRAGLINDEEFAHAWVESRERLRPKGLWSLRSELRQKGVAEETIQTALAGVDEEASAMQAARQAVGRLAQLDKATFYRRLMGFLQRRGFGYDISRHVSNQLWRELNRASPDDDA